jgi:hypothetical protein
MISTENDFKIVYPFASGLGVDISCLLAETGMVSVAFISSDNFNLMSTAWE